jgi:DNA/RNA-binding domain of Phe-tRNA-synthetase-like protein
VVATDYPSGFEENLSGLLHLRRQSLGPSEEAVRLAARDMLRNGRYKPTGRGKPASEYLLRAAAEGEFPRINPLVDICNYISLKALVPSSLWDRDRAERLGAAGDYTARLGGQDESYVFNASGQSIDLQDLVLLDHAGTPIVNPIKDCQATKTDAHTGRVGAVVYFPSMIEMDRESVCAEYAALLGACGSHVTSGWALQSHVETSWPGNR